MLYTIAFIQLSIFGFFWLLEHSFPNRQHPIARHFTFWWACVVVLSLVWLRVIFYLWTQMDDGVLPWPTLPPLLEGMLFYLIYSFGNYWLHRWKHTNSFLWHYVHRLHHSPSHMEAKLSFYRHPIEILLNTGYIVVLGGFTLGVSLEALAIALAIEGSLECFHHANIRLPKPLRKLGYVFQTPEMHLIHHEYGLHRHNYAPFLWDTIFGTVRIPVHWDKKLGFKNSHSVTHYLLLKKSS